MATHLNNHWTRLLILFTLCTSLILSGAAQAESKLRVSPEELKTQLKQPNLVIIDARSFESYAQNHIPGAVNFPEPLTYEHKSLNGQIVQPSQMQKIARDLGLTVDKPIIIYDSGELMAAARVFWSLEVYGFNNVKVLNQGFEGWIKENYPLSQEIPKVEPSSYVTVINHNRIATKLKTQIATKSPKKVIIDARPQEYYFGKKSSAKRFGHIPSALNIPASHNLQKFDRINALQSTDKLRALYADIPRDQKIVLYCAIGRISTTNYLVLRELGYDVSNYDASWKEWGNDFSMPITQINLK